MADTNTYVTIGMVTRRILMVFRNNLVFSSNVNRKYENQFAVTGAKIGAVVQIREPTPFVVHDGPTFVGGTYKETTVPLTIDQHKHCDLEMGLVQQTLNFDDWSKRVGEPKGIELANTVDLTGLQTCYWQIANSVGGGSWAAGSWTDATNTRRAYSMAAALLDDFAVPRDGRRMAVLSQWEMERIVDSNAALFHSGPEITKSFEDGMLRQFAGLKFNMDQNIITHTNGQRGGTPVVDLGGQTGSVLNTKSWTSAAANRLKRGDVFQVAGVYAVNPRSRLSTGRLQDFTVTADADSTSGGLVAIPISPAIILSPDPRQTVSASPIDGALLSFMGSVSGVYKQNLVYHTDAFTLATVDLEKPPGNIEASRVTDPDNGFSMTAMRDFDARTYTSINRCDILYGWAAIRRPAAVRVWEEMN